MAKDDLTGNMPTENIVRYLQERNVQIDIDQNKLNEAILHTSKVFP